jgi:RHS repeat-associated protein
VAQGAASGVTTYNYDAVGNLQNFTYPNGVTSAYSYDALNRLTQMGSSKSATSISNYAYTLGAAGNRLTVAELSERTVNYGYDSLYRVTSEAVTSDPNNHNGTTSYQYDAVGNRKQLLVNGVTANAYTYDADDRLGSDTYDADGNTINSFGTANTYDFENHMVTDGYVGLMYDGDGDRAGETVGGVTTNYLVDTVNPTGYAQVVDELQNGTVTRAYSYGLERINENQILNSTWAPSFYGYDGHGSVRQLTNSAGAITDTYDYDAFGTLIDSTGSTPNNYLFAGEAYDAALGLYYNRARYLNTTTGRFWSMDTYEGDDQEPLSLHKYLYVEADPADNVDPCGKCVPSTGNYGQQVQQLITLDFLEQIGAIANQQDVSITSILGSPVPGWQGGNLRPDLIDTVTFNTVGQVYEIKSVYSEAAGLAKVTLYAAILNKFDKQRTWIPGLTYLPTPIIPVDGSTIAIVSRPYPGVISYCLINQAELISLAAAAAVAALDLAFSTASLEEAYEF